MRKFVIMMILMIMSGCGFFHKVSGTTQHNVHTESTAEVIIRIDVSACQDLPAQDRLACINQMTSTIKDLKDVAEILICIGNQANAPSQSVDIAKSCRPLDPSKGE